MFKLRQFLTPNIFIIFMTYEIYQTQNFLVMIVFCQNPTQLQLKTRLISIVSKPIKLICGRTKIFGQKNFGQKYFW